MRKLWRTGVVTLAGLLMVGCQQGGARSAATPAPIAEGTAWWKTESSQGAATESARLTGQPLKSWTSMPNVVPALAVQGQEIFKSKGCVSCHSIGKGQVVGPDLLGITHRAEADWVARFISNPPAMLERDPRAQELLEKYLVKMPNLNLTDAQVRALQEYFRQQDEAAERGVPLPATK